MIEVRDKITNKGQRIPKPDTNSDEYKKRVELLVEHEVWMISKKNIFLRLPTIGSKTLFLAHYAANIRLRYIH